MQRSLARRILSEPGGNNIAHDALIDRCGVDARAPYGFAHGNCAQLRRGKIRQRALKLTNRRAHARDDHNFFHNKPHTLVRRQTHEDIKPEM